MALAIFEKHTDGPPLTRVPQGQTVVVRVGVGAFSPRTRIDLTFLDASGQLFRLRSGLGQFHAESEELQRAWVLTVLPRHGGLD